MTDYDDPPADDGWQFFHRDDYPLTCGILTDILGSHGSGPRAIETSGTGVRVNLVGDGGAGHH